MPSRVFTHAKTKLPLPATKIAEGGQFELFKLDSKDSVVIAAKKPLVDIPHFELRTRWLRKNKKRLPTELVLPTGEVLDESGVFVGYMMPNVKDAVSLNQLLTREGRRSLGLKWGLAELVHLCILLAVLFAKCHRAKLTLADNNAENYFVVLCPATRRPIAVYRIDCVGSLLFEHRGADGKPLFLTSPAVPDYLPPELQDKDLSEKENRQTQSADVFALALFVFILLTDHHPTGYAGGPSVYSLAEKIKNKHFAFWGKLPAGAVVPPELAKAYKPVIKKTLDRPFEATFVGAPGTRPQAIAYVRALKKLRSEVQRLAWHERVKESVKCLLKSKAADYARRRSWVIFAALMLAVVWWQLPTQAPAPVKVQPVTSEEYWNDDTPPAPQLPPARNRQGWKFLINRKSEEVTP